MVGKRKVQVVLCEKKEVKSDVIAFLMWLLNDLCQNFLKCERSHFEKSSEATAPYVAMASL